MDTQKFKILLIQNMIVISIKDNESIDKALKRFKKKFEKTGVLRQLRARTSYMKPSIRDRGMRLRAIYRQTMFNNPESM